MYQASRLYIVQCAVQFLRKSIKKWVSNCSLKFWSQNFEKCGRARSHEKYNKIKRILVIIQGVLSDKKSSSNKENVSFGLQSMHTLLNQICACHRSPSSQSPPKSVLNWYTGSVQDFIGWVKVAIMIPAHIRPTGNLPQITPSSPSPNIDPTPKAHII